MWISKDINKTTIETNFDKTYCLLSRIVSIVVYDCSPVVAKARMS